MKKVLLAVVVLGASLSAMAYQTVPGVANPNVTQANVKATICNVGFTKTVRPPVAYTNKLKAMFVKSEGLARACIHKAHDTGKSWADAATECGKVMPMEKSAAVLNQSELDHFIPLTGGGDPWSIDNLWLEDWPTAKLKDKAEVAMQKAICSGSLSLQTAQTQMVTDYRYFTAAKVK